MRGDRADLPAIEISCERPLWVCEVRKRARQPSSWHAPLARLCSRLRAGRSHSSRMVVTAEDRGREINLRRGTLSPAGARVVGRGSPHDSSTAVLVRRRDGGDSRRGPDRVRESSNGSPQLERDSFGIRLSYAERVPSHGTSLITHGESDLLADLPTECCTRTGSRAEGDHGRRQRRGAADLGAEPRERCRLVHRAASVHPLWADQSDRDGVEARCRPAPGAAFRRLRGGRRLLQGSRGGFRRTAGAGFGGGVRNRTRDRRI